MSKDIFHFFHINATICCIFYIYSISQFKLAIVQAFTSCMWLTTTILVQIQTMVQKISSCLFLLLPTPSQPPC